MKEHQPRRLAIGDTVLWRGFPPEVPTQTARVTGIEHGGAADFTHNGEEVPELPWKHVKDATIVFEDGHWDYGYNIRRLRTPRAWHADTATQREQHPMTGTTPPRGAEQPEDDPTLAGDQQHIDFLQGILEYEWETTPDDTESRKAFLRDIEQAQAWLQGLADAQQERPAHRRAPRTPAPS